MLRERAKTEIDLLDSFYSSEVGCEPELFYESGVHLVASQQRVGAAWGGFTKPVLALARQQSLAVSFRPDLESRILMELTSGGDGALSVWSRFERLRRVCQRAVPYGFLLSGHSMYCGRSTFRPASNRTVPLARDDPRGQVLRSRFDGEIFVVFGPRGAIASWSAIKVKSDQVWEIAVVTESAYRGRGLAREVVSAATAHILDHGRVPLYIYDRSNVASGKVCRSLGYQEYGQEFFCEY